MVYFMIAFLSHAQILFNESITILSILLDLIIYS
jgi:hypothetical protein